MIKPQVRLEEQEISSMNPRQALLIPLAAATLAGCASTTTAVAPASSAPPCVTHACIAADIQKSLIGLVAKDEAVVTKAACKPSTVKQNAGQTWTVACTVTESDGSVASGYANLLPAAGKITWDPQTVISS